MLDETLKNCFVLIKSSAYKIISKFERNNQYFFVCKKFLSPKSFFTQPMDSITGFGIMLVDKMSELEEVFELTSISFKLLGLPYNNAELVLIPILHLI